LASEKKRVRRGEISKEKKKGGGGVGNPAQGNSQRPGGEGIHSAGGRGRKDQRKGKVGLSKFHPLPASNQIEAEDAKGWGRNLQQDQ